MQYIEYPRLSSALLLINTSSPSRAGQATMAGNVEEVSRKLRHASDEHIDVIHWLLGPTDMIVHVHANDFDELLKVVDDRVLPLKTELHNYIASVETLIVKNSKARKRLSGLDQRPKRPTAWVFANTNIGGANVGDNLLEHPNVCYVAHVIGRYDMVLLLESETLPELGATIDKTLRVSNFLTTTDTRMVLM